MSLSSRLPHLASAPGRYGPRRWQPCSPSWHSPAAFASSACAAGDGQIKGTVTSALSTEGVKGIEVCAYTETAVEGGALEGKASSRNARPPGQTANTRSRGCRPANTKLNSRFPTKSELNYITQYYNGSSSPSGAELVTVTGSETISGINAKLEEGGWITGRVTDASSTNPIKGIEVCAFSKDTFGGHCATTNSEGDVRGSRLWRAASTGSNSPRPSVVRSTTYLSITTT